MRVNNIQSKSNIQNKKNVSCKGLDGRNIIRTLSNPDSLMATVALESFVTGGRGINAYKRGGKDEFRERFTDDVVSAVFWMKGVDMFNKIGDKIGEHVLHLPTTEFDVGKDALRTPFANLSAAQAAANGGEEAAKSIVTKLAAFKFTKIIASTLLATSVIGFIMPRVNQKITEMSMKKKQNPNNKPENNSEQTTAKSNTNASETAKNDKSKTNVYLDLLNNSTFEEFDKRINSKNTQSFKGLGFVESMTGITHGLENNTICKMLTNDAGIITGRTLSARNKDEGLEYLFRDTSSLFFYFASTPLIYGLLQKVTGSNNLTSLDPVAAKTLHKNLLEQLKNADGTVGSMKAADFAKKTMGALDEGAKAVFEKLPFNSDVISLKELSQHIKDSKLLEKAKEMAKLQPEQAGVGAVLTRQQVSDVLKNGSMNTPEFMQGIFKERFGEKLTNPYRFIPMKKITKFRDNIDKYAQSVIDIANKSNGGMVDAELLEKINKKNFAMSAGFRIFAMCVSAIALGFVIPKLQYALTERRTGSKTAPGLRQYEEQDKK